MNMCFNTLVQKNVAIQTKFSLLRNMTYPMNGESNEGFCLGEVGVLCHLSTANDASNCGITVFELPPL